MLDMNKLLRFLVPVLWTSNKFIFGNVFLEQNISETDFQSIRSITNGAFKVVSIVKFCFCYAS